MSKDPLQQVTIVATTATDATIVADPQTPQTPLPVERLRVGYHAALGWAVLGGRTPKVETRSGSGATRIFPSLEAAMATGIDLPGLEVVLARHTLAKHKKLLDAAEAGREAQEMLARRAEEAAEARVVLRLRRAFRRRHGRAITEADLLLCLVGNLMAIETASTAEIHGVVDRAHERFVALLERRAIETSQAEARARAAEARTVQYGPFGTNKAAARLSITEGRFRSVARELGLKPDNIVRWSTGYGSSRHDYRAYEWSLASVTEVSDTIKARAQARGARAEATHAKRATAWDRLALDEEDTDSGEEG